jgi:hypothetical protein
MESTPKQRSQLAIVARRDLSVLSEIDIAVPITLDAAPMGL